MNPWKTLCDHIEILTFIARGLTVLIGLAALILGFYYFRSRLKNEEKRAASERRRNRIGIILEQLNSYDLFVNKILSFDIKDGEELTLVRDKIDQSFEQVTIWLENNDKLLGFNEAELKNILAVNSFVEKNSLIMEDDFKTLTRENLHSLRPYYVELIQTARSVCLIKTE